MRYRRSDTAPALVYFHCIYYIYTIPLCNSRSNPGLVRIQMDFSVSYTGFWLAYRLYPIATSPLIHALAPSANLTLCSFLHASIWSIAFFANALPSVVSSFFSSSSSRPESWIAPRSSFTGSIATAVNGRNKKDDPAAHKQRFLNAGTDVK